jgi:hypothetical protein
VREILLVVNSSRAPFPQKGKKKKAKEKKKKGLSF